MTRVIIESGATSNLKSLVKSAVENELKVIRFGISKTKRKLEELEERFGMKSNDFYKKYNEGKMGDDLEHIRWAGGYETLDRLQRDYNDLLGTEICS